jgi:hypothetical protein
MEIMDGEYDPEMPADFKPGQQMMSPIREKMRSQGPEKR